MMINARRFTNKNNYKCYNKFMREMIMSFKFFEYVISLNLTVMRKMGYKTQKTILTNFN